MDRQTDRQTDGETDRQTDGRTDGGRDRRTRRHDEAKSCFSQLCERACKTGMPIKLLQSVARKIVAKMVMVAVVVYALEPIQFQRCKTQVDVLYPVPSTVHEKFQISFYCSVVSGSST